MYIFRSACLEDKIYSIILVTFAAHLHQQTTDFYNEQTPLLRAVKELPNHYCPFYKQMAVFNSLLEAVASCDKFPYEIDASSTDEIHHATPIILGPHLIGNVLPHALPHLQAYNESLEESKRPFVITPEKITFAVWVKTPDLRTNAVKTLMDFWREQKTFQVLAGWRNELYPVYGDASQPDNVAFVMERAATPLFGISTFGCHLNAFTRDSEGNILMWVARRSKSKQTYPGLLDNCVNSEDNYFLLRSHFPFLTACMYVGRWWYLV